MFYEEDNNIILKQWLRQCIDIFKCVSIYQYSPNQWQPYGRVLHQYQKTGWPVLIKRWALFHSMLDEQQRGYNLPKANTPWTFEQLQTGKYAYEKYIWINIFPLYIG